jgi:ATP-binding cassette subfamily D (ALD) protein 3
MGIFDSMLVKYGATIVGYGILGLPVFTSRATMYKKGDSNDTGAIAKDYVKNSALLINLAKVYIH